MKSTPAQIFGEILSILNPLSPEERRQFFGAASKCLLDRTYWDAPAPVTGYETFSGELTSFQKGFSGLKRSHLTISTKATDDDFVDALLFISGANRGKKQRLRDRSRKMHDLRKRTRKALRQLQTPRPLRGINVFYGSVIAEYIRGKPFEVVSGSL
jgi:hypothetical protein